MKHLRVLGTFALTLTLAACSQAESPTTPTAEITTSVVSEAVMTKTKAVLIYADWCGSCKVLDPKIKSVQAMGALPGLEYVTLDYTDKNVDRFYSQAENAGVIRAVRTYLDGTIKTGQLLLVDMDDQAVIGKVTKALEPSEIIVALKDALAAS